MTLLSTAQHIARDTRRDPRSHMILIMVAVTIAASAVALVAYLLWPTWVARPAGAPERLPVSVGATLFNVPATAIRRKIQRHSGPQERVDLNFVFPSLEPPAAPKHVSADTIEEKVQPIDRIFVSISAHSDSLAPDMRVRTIYPRYLQQQATPLDGGLTMRAFRDHEIDVLVSTTVIEVGIDVANATVMLIEHPERFGLSQLHQLRGRVGRGAEESYCILLGDAAPDSKQRLEVFVKTEDGFEIARADLELRGMGDLFGERQSGMPTFKVANPLRDEQLMLLTRELASTMLERDPELTHPEHAGIRRALTERYARALELFRVG